MGGNESLKVSFVIGNGHSRTVFDLDDLIGKGTTYGCNLLVHDHDLDNVVACDRHMVVDLVSQGIANKTNLYTRSRWLTVISAPKVRALPDPVKDPKVRYDKELHWNSGVHALNLAAHDGADVIVMIGFDLWPRADGRNNIYQDRPGYNSDPVDPSHWIYQIGLLLKKYPNVSFVQIQPDSWQDPDSWKSFDNYSRDSYAGLREWLRNM